MKLKPKSTTQNPKALLYKRFIGLEKSLNLQTVYKTSDNKYWTFDTDATIEPFTVENSLYYTSNGFSQNQSTFSSVGSRSMSGRTTITLWDKSFTFEGKKRISKNTEISGNFKLAQSISYYYQSLYPYVNVKLYIYIRRTGEDWRLAYEEVAQEITIAEYPTLSSFDFNAKLTYLGDEMIVYNNDLEIRQVIEIQGLTYNNAVFSIRGGEDPEYCYLTIKPEEFFDNHFKTIDKSLIPATSKVVDITDFTSVLSYRGEYYRYTGTKWEDTDTTDGLTLLSATFNNIAKYQTDKYYFAGSFDYVIKGSVEGTTTQYIKGNVIPLTALSIKHFNDEIKLSVEDLVVIEGKLYSVENPETVYKQQPKKYSIYFATLNSIL